MSKLIRQVGFNNSAEYREFVRIVKPKGLPLCPNSAYVEWQSWWTWLGKSKIGKFNLELKAEWHPTKNGKLIPNDVATGSKKRVWWLGKCGHEWEQSIYNRSYALQGCPYCSNKKVCTDNCLATLNPELAKEWHPTKNGKLTPNDLTLGSGKRVWWLGKCGHEWQTCMCLKSKTIGGGCPYCSGSRVCKENCLATLNPKLAKEWHPSKNGTLTPADVTIGSGIKRWWLGECGHEWQASISSRRTCGCSYCSRRRVCKDNCLATLNSELAKEWHPTKNGKLTPNDVTPGSHKKVWWVGKCGHEWKTSVLLRNNGSRSRRCHKCLS